MSPRPSDGEPPAKRRKVRKGTQSCWECKRRKVRCIFALPTNATCDNCIRRGTACISQEYLDGPKAHTNDRNVIEGRLRRVEDILEQLAKNSSTARPHPSPDRIPRAISENCSEPGIQTYNSTDASSPPSQAAIPTGYTGLAGELVAVWPSQHDLDRIYAFPIGLSTHLHMQRCSSLTSLSHELTSPQAMLQLPAPGSHPVLIAKKLLLLGSLLQGALSASQALGTLQDHFTEIMARVVNAATSLVTTNDDLTASIEGIECILIEAMIQNYAGKLHRAWMTIRRASAVAQVAELYRDSKRPSLKMLDPGMRASFDPDHLCFRILEMDCYLSTTLGLPQSSLETRALTPEMLAKCEPLDRMARLQCIVARRILTQDGQERSENGLTDVHEIGLLLQNSATEMPPLWWLIPDFKSCDIKTPKALPEISRIMYQFSHYHLIVRLHLPYVLRSSTNDSNDDSKIAAANASRDILSRYVAFRTWNSGHFYCRGIDFIAFIAFTVLCLAHVDSQTYPAASSDNGHSFTNVRKIFDYNHLNDRGLMERTFQLLDRMENDEVASKLAPIMQHLLTVEAEAVNGVDYSAVTTRTVDGGVECDGEFVDGKKTLQLHIPYFGTIHFQRRVILKPAGGTQPQEHPISHTVTSNPDLPDQVVAKGQPSLAEWSSQCAQATQPSHSDWELSNGVPLPDMLDFTNELTTPDDWTLQSINENLFSNLFSDMDYQDLNYDL